MNDPLEKSPAHTCTTEYVGKKGGKIYNHGNCNHLLHAAKDLLIDCEEHFQSDVFAIFILFASKV